MLTIKLVNDGTGTAKVGNYRYEVAINSEVISFGEVKGHNRREGWRGLLLELVAQSSKSELEALIFKEDKWQSM